MEVVRDLTEYPEVLWTFYGAQPLLAAPLREQLDPGIDRGQVNLYAGIDCNRLFPHLYERWLGLQPEAKLSPTAQSNPVRVSEALASEVTRQKDRPTVIEGDDEDRPPLVDICVGREVELSALNHSIARVVFVTGIGGQGKSTLAARYFTSCQDDLKFSIYVWRDCKEERERFENQLSSVIEKLTDGKISGEDLAHQKGASIVEVLLSVIGERRVLFVFDNVDHYVDLESLTMTGIPDLFIKALMASQLESQVVFTCRPDVSYANPSALSTHLEGISLDVAITLFSQRGASSSAAEIEEAHQFTNGHAFWLDLLAIQVVKQGSQTKLRSLISQIGAGGNEFLPDNTLRSIWTTLKPQEQTVLRALAETLRPETEIEIVDYLSSNLTYKKVMKALKNLRSLNLVVIKKRDDAPDLLELHPLVRHFIRSSFAPQERLSFIKLILAVYAKFVGMHKRQLADRPSFSVLQYWTQSAELDMAAGRFNDAFAILSEVATPFLGSAYPREFTRTARMLFGAVDWTSTPTQTPYFDFVFRSYVHFLCELGEDTEVDRVLEQYEVTLANKDARYISYCDLRCYSKWTRGDFSAAVRWGQKGKDLKASSGADIKFDPDHNLALAERDAGRPEGALATFLAGRPLAEVIDPEELDEQRPGDYYGNIGRCLHLMGQLDGALACYQKSALILEKARQEHIVNQGYIRAWIGELLVGKEQTRLASVFLKAAYLKWQQASPPRALRVEEMLVGLRKSSRRAEQTLDDSQVERICRDWILGKNLDSDLR